MFDTIALLLRSKALQKVFQVEISKRLGLRVAAWDNLDEATAALTSQPDRYLTAITNPHFTEQANASVELVLKTQVPCVVLTASFSEPLRQELLSRGVADYVVKDQNLVDNVTRLLHRMQQGRGKTILLVDDSTVARRTAREYLDRLGFRVLEASDGEAALEAVRSHPEIRLVLTDFEMPGMNGAELASRIRAQWGWDELSIIGLSGSNQYATLTAEFLKRGASDFLRKPFQPEELFCRVFHHLEMHNYIDHLREERQKAAILATTDVLTGAFNRRAFFAQGNTRLTDAAAHQHPVSAVMLDIDHFKKFNDQHGHATGDDVLKSTVDACQSVLGDEALFGRLGGEEFGVLFTGLPPAQVWETCENMRCAIMENQVASPEGALLQVTSSFGLAHSDGQTTLDDLLNHADQALYEAKNSGRNCIRLWEPNVCAA